jgi:CHAT domain-containing protein
VGSSGVFNQRSDNRVLQNTGNKQIGKAEALRKAQIELLNGKYKHGETPLWKRSVEVKEAGQTVSTFKTDSDAQFAHPYFWSPFILFGNWK